MSSFNWRVVCALAMLVAAASVNAGEDEKSEAYQLTIKSKDTSSDNDKPAPVAESKTCYRLIRGSKETTVVFDSSKLTMTLDGLELTSYAFDRTKAVLTSLGKPIEILVEKAPSALQEKLRDSYGAPLCKFTYDDDGRETKRVVVAGAGAKLLLEHGEIDTVLMVHAPFPAKADKWEAQRAVGMNAGEVAKGALTYEKVKTMGKLVTVKVSGELTNPRGKQADKEGLMVKDARFTFSGEQTYDTARRRWVSCDLKADFSFTLHRDDKDVTKAKGTQTWKLEALPDK